MPYLKGRTESNFSQTIVPLLPKRHCSIAGYFVRPLTIVREANVDITNHVLDSTLLTASLPKASRKQAVRQVIELSMHSMPTKTLLYVVVHRRRYLPHHAIMYQKAYSERRS